DNDRSAFACHRLNSFVNVSRLLPPFFQISMRSEPKLPAGEAAAGSLALDDLKLISRLKSDFPFRGIFQNRFRNRMIRILLQSGRSFDEFDLGMLIERDDLNHLRSSKRQRASLIESNCFEVRWRF